MNNPINLTENIFALVVPEYSETKKCTVCKENKSFKSFGFRAKNNNVLKSGCKQCYALKHSCDKSKTILQDLEGEIWKDIKYYEGFYQASNLGRIKSLDRYVDRPDKKIGYRRSRILIQPYNHRGYKMVTLNKNAKAKVLIAHRVIAKTFIPNPENKPQVNHINGIKDDNRIENLEWCTCLENIKHYWKSQNGKKPKAN